MAQLSVSTGSMVWGYRLRCMRFSFATRPQRAGRTDVKQRSAGRWMTERAAPRTSRFQHKNPRQTWRLTRGTTQESKSWHHRLHEGRKRDGSRATAGERTYCGKTAESRPTTIASRASGSVLGPSLEATALAALPLAARLPLPPSPYAPLIADVL